MRSAVFLHMQRVLFGVKKTQHSRKGQRIYFRLSLVSARWPAPIYNLYFDSFLLICTSFVVRTRGIVCVVYLLSRLANYKDPCKWCGLRRRQTTAGNTSACAGYLWSSPLKIYRLLLRSAFRVQLSHFALILGDRQEHNEVRQTYQKLD